MVEFRTAMVNFDNEENLKTYVKKYIKDLPKINPYLSEIIVNRTSPTSVQIIVTADTDELVSLKTKEMEKWREDNKFEGVIDTMLLQGDVLFNYKNYEDHKSKYKSNELEDL